jgi:NAD(P)H dehydrogenase (quinone)
MHDISEVSEDDMEWADGYFFSAPTRFGVVASQMRAFIDTLSGLWAGGKLANKTFTATTSAQNRHGGQESTLLSLYTTAMHWGSIIVVPGYTDQSIYEAGGNPYGFSTNAGGFDEKGEKAVAHQAKRLVEFTTKITT